MELFNRSRNMSSYKTELFQRVSGEIENLSEDELINSDDSLKLIFTSKFHIPEIVLGEIYQKDGGYREEDISKNPRFWASIISEDHPVYKRAKIIEVHIPFWGDPEFLRIQPSTFKMVPVRGKVVNNEIVIDFLFFSDSDSPNSVKAQIENELRLIREHVDFMNKDIQDFNKNLPGIILRDLKIRRTNLDKEREVIKSIGIPQKEENQIGFVIPINKIDVKLESTTSITDPVLEESVYKSITSHVNSLGINLERCKSHIRSLDEESLRDIFFTALNSSYKGLVSTEAFNHSGKTDILIRHKDNNLYISEFKIWGGYDYFSNGITQLLNNLTWRDSKCSYVVFSRNKDFSNVISKAQELILNHPQCVKFLEKESEGCFKFLFKGKSSDTKIIMTLHLFDLS